MTKHSFTIPVMGLGYTMDTAIRIAHLGISSVISLSDDILIEKMREFYSKQSGIIYNYIDQKVEDFRARRITAYLNLVDQLVNKKYEELILNFHKKESELQRYFDLLPDSKHLREKFAHFRENNSLNDVKTWLRENILPGSIDVNIMTKLDKANSRNHEKLPVEFNDAHAALRGFANSNLQSSLVLSAGLNPRLYSYLENFPDFYPDENCKLRKKIILKVSDYRSAEIQGRFLAKKGIWISEYRVESGLNCGGHAFATQGYLMGPILQEFKEKRAVLSDSTFTVYKNALKDKGITIDQAPEMKITAQGGVGTYEEHQMLLDIFQMDSVGWGSPFLLVPEACNLEEETMELLRNADEDDLYLSDASPLGVQFNNVRGASQQVAIQQFIDEGKPGFPCTKKFLVTNTEFTSEPICTASRLYIRKKTEEIDQSGLSAEEKLTAALKLTEKECLCEGLANSTYTANGIETDSKRTGVSICPGPNIAYFKQIISLKEMVDHIYGKLDLLKGVKRPNLFIKELGMYVDYFAKMVSNAKVKDDKQNETFRKFRQNLLDGIEFYRQFFRKYEDRFLEMKKDVFAELDKFSNRIEEIG